MIQTARLLLRQWQSSDHAAFVAMNKDDKVMQYFPEKWSSQRSLSFIESFTHLIDIRRYGFWATVERDSNNFIGFVGLNDVPENLPIDKDIEIGWRLIPEYWGRGYATEAAEGALAYAFNELKVPKIVAFTPVANQKSRRVMEKLGMSLADETFLHPNVSAASGLQEHVLYALHCEQ